MNVEVARFAVLDMRVLTDRPDEEQRLVSAALEGDGRAFGSLVRPHLQVMYRIARRGCSDPSLAEDAVQEALTIAHRKLGSYRVGTSLRAFLASIVVKRTHTLLRSERRRKAREETSRRPDREPTPEEYVNAAALGQRIRETFAKMPKKRRAAALLRLDGGMAYEDIAGALNTSVGSARVLVHLALKDLKVGLGTVHLGGRDGRSQHRDE